MKKYIYMFLFSAMVGISGCSFLDKEPDTELTLEMVFEDKTRMMGWLASFGL